MKPLASAAILLFAGAAGAFTHHVVASGRATFSARKPPVAFKDVSAADRAAIPGAPAAAIGINADSVLETMHGDSRIALDELLSSLTAPEFLPLARELIHRGEEIDFLLEYWAAADAKGLLDFAEERSKEPDAYGLLRAAYDHCFAFEPDAVFASILRLQAAGYEKSIVEDFLSSADSNPASDPAAIVTAAAKHGVIDRISIGASFVEGWAKQDPAAALAFAKTVIPDSIGFAISGWASNDPDAALAWVREQPRGAETDRVIQILAEYHPREADRLLDLVTDPAQFYSWQASGMARLPLPEMTAWLQSVPPERQKSACDRLCTVLVAYDDVASAIALCGTFPEIVSDATAESVIGRLSWSDPVAAVQFLGSARLHAGIREEALPAVVDSWLQMDREAALAFIEAQPPDELKGRMMLEASRILDDGDNEAARDAALKLPHPAMRIGALRRIAGARFPESDTGDMDAFRKWIAGISDPMVRAALDPPPVTVPPESPRKEVPADPFASPEGPSEAPPDPFSPR